MEPPPPQLLDYDRPPKKADPKMVGVQLSYCCGLFLTTIANFAVIVYVDKHDGAESSSFSPEVDGLATALGFFMLQLLLATIFLGFSLWLKSKLITDLRYARRRIALLCGFVGGVPSPLIGKYASASSTSPLLLIMLLLLAWYCIYPLVAGLLLSRRCHLRE